MLLLLLTGAAGKADWDYPAKNAGSGGWGPVHEGGDVGPESSWYGGSYNCATGKVQSPIDVPKAALSSYPRSNQQFNYDSAGLTVTAASNNGHTVGLEFKLPAAGATPKNFIKIGGKMYVPAQTHFHAGSENFLDGKQQAVEMHFVHVDLANKECQYPKCLGPNLAVMGMFFQRASESASSSSTKKNGDSDANELFDYFAKTPTTPGKNDISNDNASKAKKSYKCTEIAGTSNCKLKFLFNKYGAGNTRTGSNSGTTGGNNPRVGTGSFAFTNFIGSLTTPPCAQGANWFLDMSAPSTISGCKGNCGYYVKAAKFDALLARFFPNGAGWGDAKTTKFLETPGQTSSSATKYKSVDQKTAYKGKAYLRNFFAVCTTTNKRCTTSMEWCTTTTCERTASTIASSIDAQKPVAGVVITKSMGNFRSPQNKEFTEIAAAFRGIRNMGTANVPAAGTYPVMYKTSNTGSLMASNNYVNANACANNGAGGVGCSAYPMKFEGLVVRKNSTVCATKTKSSYCNGVGEPISMVAAGKWKCGCDCKFPFTGDKCENGVGAIYQLQTKVLAMEKEIAALSDRRRLGKTLKKNPDGSWADSEKEKDNTGETGKAKETSPLIIIVAGSAVLLLCAALCLCSCGGEKGDGDDQELEMGDSGKDTSQVD